MGEKENRLEITRKHISKAKETLRAAEILCDSQIYSDSISRSYYVVFHTARALLTFIGESAKSHQGVFNLIYIHFVENDIISKDLNRKINQLQGSRSTADYGFMSIFTASDAELGIGVAKEFIDVAEKWISS